MTRPSPAHAATIELGLAHLAVRHAADDIVGHVKRRMLPTPRMVHEYEAAVARVVEAESALALAVTQ